MPATSRPTATSSRDLSTIRIAASCTGRAPVSIASRNVTLRRSASPASFSVVTEGYSSLWVMLALMDIELGLIGDE